VTEITAFRFCISPHDSETAVGAFCWSADGAVELKSRQRLFLADCEFSRNGAPKVPHNADAVVDRADGNSDEHGEDEAVE
jgi:hypothetical protein